MKSTIIDSTCPSIYRFDIMLRRSREALGRKQVSNTNAKRIKNKGKSERKTNREIEEVTKQLEKEKTEINRVLEQELGAYIKTRLEKEHFADIWSSTDCHGEEQKAETVFLAKVVTAKTRLRFPFLKNFKFSSQVMITEPPFLDLFQGKVLADMIFHLLILVAGLYLQGLESRFLHRS